ncbi:MAG: hypothetical protein ACLGG7_09595 [Bacteriovoracia bacterium]
MKVLFSLLLALGLVLPASAKAQIDSLGFSVIDYKAFLQLDRADQHAYLKLIMRTVAEMEATVGVKSLEEQKQVQVLRQILNQLIISEAYAAQAQASEACLYAGWFSTYERVGGKPVCRRPQLSKDAGVRANYQRTQRHCPSSKQACNPDIFGSDESDKPFCVNTNKVHDHNASLACLMEFNNLGTAGEARLDRMIARLSTTPGAATNFNKVVQTIFNTCVCQQNAANDGYNVQIAQGYFDYMKGKRTCYSLLTQTQHIAQRMKQNNSANACFVINPSNVEVLARDLSALSEFSNNVSDMISAESVGRSGEPYETVLSRYKDTLPYEAGTAANKWRGLDGITPLDNCLEKLKDPSRSIECVLPVGQQIGGLSHCPLVIPPVVQTTCSIAVTPGMLEGQDMNFSATLTLSDATASITDNKVSWTLDGATPQTTEGTVTFTGKVPAPGGKARVGLSAKLKVGERELTCRAANDEHTAIVSKTITACKIADGASAKIENGKLIVTATVEPQPAGLAITTKWKFGAEEKETPEFTAPAEQTGPVSITAMVTSTDDPAKSNVTCEAAIPLPAAEETPPPATVTPETGTCLIQSMTAVNEQGQEVLDVTVQGQGEKSAPKTAAKFEGLGLKVKDGSKTAASAVIQKTSKARKEKIKVSYVSEGDKAFSCEKEVEIGAKEPATPRGGGPAPMAPMPPLPSAPDIFLQGIN